MSNMSKRSNDDIDEFGLLMMICPRKYKNGMMTTLQNNGYDSSKLSLIRLKHLRDSVNKSELFNNNNSKYLKASFVKHILNKDASNYTTDEKSIALIYETIDIFNRCEQIIHIRQLIATFYRHRYNRRAVATD